MSKGKIYENKPQDTAVKADIATTNTITPYEQYQTDYFKRFTDWQNQGGSQDISQAPGMSNFFDIYGNAQTAAAKQRIGDPAHSFTANLPGFNNQLQAQKQMDMYNTRASGLSNAYQGLQAQALGAGANAAQLQQGREGQFAGLMNQYNTSYYGRPVQQPLWQTIAGLAVGGLGAAAGTSGLRGAGGLF